ncbi:hypothetical protein [Mucilaginibacter kameinonensis]|uniref:hypothetical protein n=1 Tax=Mucilaginibacter kameinonensis TaxID=452286 RepID=UPI000EF7595D|nr:hypothetical protein [Mucilaginibacter kameinonensis]
MLIFIKHAIVMDILPYLPVILVFTMKMACFLFGYLTIRLGYKLINSGVKGEFKFSAGYHGVKGGLVSSSPGLLFVLLGIILIAFAIKVEKPYEINKNSAPSNLYTPAIPTDFDPLPKPDKK